MESINAKLEELQKELLKRANANKDYNNFADEIDRLREQKQNAMAENAEREDCFYKKSVLCRRIVGGR